MSSINSLQCVSRFVLYIYNGKPPGVITITQQPKCYIIQERKHLATNDACIVLEEVLPSKSLFLSGDNVHCMCTGYRWRFSPSLSFPPSISNSFPPLPPLGWHQPHPSSAQLTSLATLPPADRQLREPALISKRATVEAWLTREANTLQKYRLVGHEHALNKSTLYLVFIHNVTLVCFYWCVHIYNCQYVITSQPFHKGQMKNFTMFLRLCMFWTVCLCPGPGRKTPENIAAVEEAADHHSGWWADPVEETATAGRQRGPTRGRPGHPAVLVSSLPPPTKITATRTTSQTRGHRFTSLQLTTAGFISKVYWLLIRET